MIRCPQCQAELGEGKRFCPQCGVRLTETPHDMGKTIVTPPPAPSGDVGRTVLLPPEGDAGKTMVTPPQPTSSGASSSSAGLQTILEDQARRQSPPPEGSGFGLPPAAPSAGGGFGVPPSLPPPAGGGAGKLPAALPSAVGGGSGAPAAATTAKKGPNWLLIIGIIVGVLVLACILILGVLYLVGQQVAQSLGIASFEIETNVAIALLFGYRYNQNSSINSRRRYRIGRRVHDTFSLLSDRKTAPAINAAGSSNRSWIDMTSDALTFFCNGQRLTSLRDSAFLSGNLAFGTETFHEGQGVVRFTNLVIRGR